MKTPAVVDFPIVEILPHLLATLSAGSRAVLEAPPGAGKTTQVPLALLEQPWLAGRKILLLEPRRIAARAAAEFMARQLGEEVGGTVGYRIRFEAKVSAATRIEVVTEGILTRLLQSDPELAGVGAILFDEFHERHLHGDLGAALALDVQNTLRPDLRLLVMSATLDGERIARWLDAPRLTSAGRSFPVDIVYPPARTGEDWLPHLRRVAEQALADTDGDILVFLPGKREIERARAVLSSVADAAPNLQVLALHGELSLQEQRAALTPAGAGTRRIVLATNVAESSVTLPGIRAVIDTGQAREPRFDPNSGFTRLQTVAISQASADQRAGRAGRVAPGRAYRLWPQSQRLEPSRKAELEQVELSSLALELAAWGAGTLPWLDPPPPGHLAQARELLVLLGALDADRRITALGRGLIELGATPRLAAAAVRSPAGDRALVADLLAALDARTPLRGEAGRSDDFRLRITALHAWRREGARGAREADLGALAALDQAAAGWRRRLRGDAPARDVADALRIGDLLLHAFPDRVAKQDPANPRRYALSNGRGARLHDNTALYGEPWLIALDLRLDDKDSLILSAAPFDPDLLERDFPERFTTARAVRWNGAKRAVEAFEERRFAALVLSRRQVAVTPADAVPALMAAVRDGGLDVLPWSEHARELRQRVLALRQWCPELGLPDLSDDALLASLETWLAPYLDGKSRLDALRADELSQALAGMLDYEQRRVLDAQAPVSIRVPSGNERRIEYADGQPPVLAVKLQELFGLADTPRIAQGRVPLTLHLLSPAQRPIQVTQDLKGFWERTYPEVRKELKGRYPRHPWPDDPWSAAPTARAKPRGT
ncbi:MAG: ATP-dependent helicase HrpB [Rhodanobacteraceae bacterium]